MSKSKFALTVAAVALAVLTVAACTEDKKPTGGISGQAIPSASSSSSSSESAFSAGPVILKVTATEPATGVYAFDTAGVDNVAAGDVQFTFTNSGTVEHDAVLVRVLDGNLTAYKNALDSGGQAAVQSLGQEVASAGPLAPGQSKTATVNLPAGEYVIVSFLTTSDGSTFAQHGMFRELRVLAQ